MNLRLKSGISAKTQQLLGICNASKICSIWKHLLQDHGSSNRYASLSATNQMLEVFWTF
jgi:hypothetical protein